MEHAGPGAPAKPTTHRQFGGGGAFLCDHNFFPMNKYQLTAERDTLPLPVEEPTVMLVFRFNYFPYKKTF